MDIVCWEGLLVKGQRVGVSIPKKVVSPRSSPLRVALGQTVQGDYHEQCKEYHLGGFVSIDRYDSSKGETSTLLYSSPPAW